MEIRPRAFGENLNEWFRAMGSTWKPLLVFCAWVFIPLGLLTTVLLLTSGAIESYFDLLLTDPEVQDPGEVLEILGSLVWIWLGLAIVGTLTLMGVYLAVGRAFALTANGESPTAFELLRFGWSRLGRTLLAALLLFVVFVLGVIVVSLIGWAVISSLGAEFLPVFLVLVVALTAFVLIVRVAVGVSLYPQVIAMEETGATNSLVRSFRLVRGRWWPTLGFELVAGLLVSAVSQLLSIVLVPLFLIGIAAPGFFALGWGLAVMLQGPTTAAVALAYAVWYADLRAREGELTAADLV